MPAKGIAVADNLTPEQRRKTMKAVKGRNTSLERTVGSALQKRGLRFRRCVSQLPGKPDFVFSTSKVVVFVDGAFWHGWRLPKWKHKLSDYWREKIERNRRRDRLNFQRLRRKGWKVLRFWDHQVADNLDAIVESIASAVKSASLRPVDRPGHEGLPGVMLRNGCNGHRIRSQHRRAPAKAATPPTLKGF
jgi:DNA mismatch endonuclease (patch repair protein)